MTFIKFLLFEFSRIKQSWNYFRVFLKYKINYFFFRLKYFFFFLGYKIYMKLKSIKSTIESERKEALKTTPRYILPFLLFGIPRYPVPPSNPPVVIVTICSYEGKTNIKYDEDDDEDIRIKPFIFEEDDRDWFFFSDSVEFILSLYNISLEELDALSSLQSVKKQYELLQRRSIFELLKEKEYKKILEQIISIKLAKRLIRFINGLVIYKSTLFSFKSIVHRFLTYFYFVIVVVFSLSIFFVLSSFL